MTSLQRQLAFVIGIGIALRLVALIATSPTSLVNDEISYYMLAEGFSQGHPLGEGNGRAPGVIFFYAGLFSLFGTSIQVARVGNSFLSVASLGFIFVLGRRYGGERNGLVAASLGAMYPTLIGFSHCLWSESLYIFLELAALVLLLSHRERRSFVPLLGAGLLLGVGALTREVGLLVVLACGSFLIYDMWPDWKQGIGKASVVISMSLLVVLPWSLHLSEVTGHASLVSNNTWFNLYISNVPEVVIDGRRVHPWNGYQLLGETRTAREAAARPIALRAIWDQMPLWPVRKLSEFKNLLAPHSFVTKRLRTDSGDREQDHVVTGKWSYRFQFKVFESLIFREGMAALAILLYLVVVLCGVTGFFLVRDSRTLVLLSFFVVAHVLPTLLTFALTRFRLPVMPVMMIVGAPVLYSSRLTMAELSMGRRVSAGAAVVATSMAILAGYFASPT